MSQDNRDVDAEEVGALFRTLLDQPEPAVPPVGAQVKRAGARLRSRRRSTAVLAAAVAVVAVAGAGIAVTGRPGPGVPAAAPAAATSSSVASGTASGTAEGPQNAPSTQGSPATGSPEDPASADRRLNAVGHADLLRFLRDHPLPGITRIDEGGSASEFLMQRPAGGRVRFLRQFEGPVRDPSQRESPCAPKLPNGEPADPYGTDCLPVPLPGGALGWVMHPVHRGQPDSVRLWLITAEGRLFTLGFDSAPVDGGYRTVPLEAVRELAVTPGFVEAVDRGWRDSAIR
ncbi:hypothetical protein ACFC58_11955 [Kitasatospora purpeofusca]|uniref:hypothetical protein n=1 Tax=Kitasatospora purpeofusca TaxID=67352 RepID=UPI0035DDBD58